MKRDIPLIVLSVLFASGLCAEVNEKWTFSDPDATPLSQTHSSMGTAFANGQSPIVMVEGGELKLMHDGVEEHTFRQQAFANGPFSSGVVELSWVFPRVDFSKTVAAGGSANIGFDARDLGGTLKSPMDDKVLGAVRLRCEKGGLVLQYSQTTKGGADAWISIAHMETAKLDEPLYVRMRFDLDNRLEPGAFKVFLKLGSADEIEPVADGRLPAAGSLSGYRMIQQTINGKNSWAVGDFVTVDDFTVSVGN